MSRFRVGLAVLAITMTALAVPGAFTAGGGWLTPLPFLGEISEPSARVRTIPRPTTFTLTADCGEVTSPLTVPNGYTVEGGGHMITATDPAPASVSTVAW